MGEEDVDDENDVRYFLGGQDDNGEESDVVDEQTDDNDDFDDEIDIELEDSDEDEFSVVKEEKENQEDEEREQFTDEISSEDDEDLDDLVEEEVVVATRVWQKTNATLTFGL